MNNIEEIELKLQYKKAEVAKFELELRILKAQEDINRMTTHINLQEKVMKDVTDKLKELNNV